MGLATAVYGLGSVVAAQALAMLLAIIPVQMTLLAMAAVMTLACLAAMLLLDSMREGGHVATTISAKGVSRLWLAMLWLIYFLGASGGLMVIVHSAAIIGARGGGEQNAIAPALVGLGSIAGGFLGGIMSGMLGQRQSLFLPLACLSAGLLGLLLLEGEAVGLLLMLACGAGYGMLISVIPAAIQTSYGADRFAFLLGLVFTAWGLAGLGGPALAGLIFDRMAGYDASIMVAFTFAAAGSVLSLLLPKPRLA